MMWLLQGDFQEPEQGFRAMIKTQIRYKLVPAIFQQKVCLVSCSGFFRCHFWDILASYLTYVTISTTIGKAHYSAWFYLTVISCLNHFGIFFCNCFWYPALFQHHAHSLVSSFGLFDCLNILCFWGILVCCLPHVKFLLLLGKFAVLLWDIKVSC